MNAPDSTSTRAAQHLWSRLAGNGGDMAHVLAAADAVLTELDAGLRRWIGAEGYAALLKRAIVLTLPQHPALHHIPDLAIESASNNGAVYRANDVALAMIALISTMMDLLGRIIGPEMAARLVEHVGGPSLRGSAGRTKTDARND
jgi:hypothetical protein